MSRAEQFIQEHVRNGSNVSKGFRSKGVSIPSYCLPWLTPDQARKAVEIAREEMIEKAVKWLDRQLVNDTDDVTGEHFINFMNWGVSKERFISHFKQAMKDEA